VLAISMGGRSVLGLGAVTATLQGEEPGAAPGRAGNGARNRREARIRRPLPIEALAGDRDGVALALILANQHRSWFEVATRWATLSRQAVQERQAVSIEAAEGLFLDSAGDHSPQQVFAQTRRRRSCEHDLPAAPNAIQGKRPDAINLGRDRSRVRHLPAHCYALGCAAASPWPPAIR
jgi:hypothetical protein